MDTAQLLVSSADYKTAYDAAYNLKISFIAAATLGVWDIIVTSNQERALVWPRRMSLAKVAFLLGRYYFLFGWLPLCASAVFFTYDFSTCQRVFWIHPFSCIISLLPCQLILSFRVCAVYNWNRWLLAILATLIVLAQVVPLGMLISIVPLPPLDGVSGCPGRARTDFDYTWMYWLPAAIIEGLVFFLILHRFITSRKTPLGSGQDLMGRLAVDSMLYFLPVAAVTIVNVSLFALAPPPAKALCMYPMVTLSVTLSSRLVLSLHRDTLYDDVSTVDSLQTRLLNFLTGRSTSRRTSSTASYIKTPATTRTSNVVVLTETMKSVSEPMSLDDAELGRPRTRFDEKE